MKISTTIPYREAKEVRGMWKLEVDYLLFPSLVLTRSALVEHVIIAIKSALTETIPCFLLAVLLMRIRVFGRRIS